MTERQWQAMENRLLKHYAQGALEREYGFAPPMKAITLLESHFDNDIPQYVRFEVGGHEYSYDGITLDKLN